MSPRAAQSSPRHRSAAASAEPRPAAAASRSSRRSSGLCRSQFSRPDECLDLVGGERDAAGLADAGAHQPTTQRGERHDGRLRALERELEQPQRPGGVNPGDGHGPLARQGRHRGGVGARLAFPSLRGADQSADSQSEGLLRPLMRLEALRHGLPAQSPRPSPSGQAGTRRPRARRARAATRTRLRALPRARGSGAAT